MFDLTTVREKVLRTALAACLCLWPNLAQAYPIRFTFDDSLYANSTGGILGFNGSFLVDSSAPPISYLNGESFLVSYTNGTGDFALRSPEMSTFGIVNADSPNEDGANISITSNRTSQLFRGQKIYSGPESAPTYLVGTYALRQLNVLDRPAVATLTISAANGGGPGAPAPEVGAGILSGLLVAVILFATRLRRKPTMG